MAPKQRSPADEDPKTSCLAGEGTTASFGVPSDAALSGSYPGVPSFISTPDALVQQVVKTTTELATALQQELVSDLRDNLGVGKQETVMTRVLDSKQHRQLVDIRDSPTDNGMTAFCNPAFRSLCEPVTDVTSEVASHLVRTEDPLSSQADQARGNASPARDSSAVTCMTQDTRCSCTAVDEGRCAAEESGQQTGQSPSPGLNLLSGQSPAGSASRGNLLPTAARSPGSGEERGNENLRVSDEGLGQTGFHGGGGSCDGDSADGARLRSGGGLERKHLKEGDKDREAWHESASHSRAAALPVPAELSSGSASTVSCDRSKDINTSTPAPPETQVRGQGLPAETPNSVQAPTSECTETLSAFQRNEHGTPSVQASHLGNSENVEASNGGVGQTEEKQDGIGPRADSGGSGTSCARSGDRCCDSVDHGVDGSFAEGSVSAVARQVGDAGDDSIGQQSPLLRMSTSFASFEKLPSVSSQHDSGVMSAETDAARQEENALEPGGEGEGVEGFGDINGSSRSTTSAYAGSASETGLSASSGSSLITRRCEIGSFSSSSSLSPVLVSPLSVGEVSPTPSPGAGPAPPSWTLATIRLPPPVCAFSTLPFLSTAAAPPVRISSSISTSSTSMYCTPKQTDTASVLTSYVPSSPTLPSTNSTDGVLAVFCPRHPHHQHLHSVVGPHAENRAYASKSSSRDRSPSSVEGPFLSSSEVQGEPGSRTPTSPGDVASSSSPGGIFARLLSRPPPGSGVRPRSPLPDSNSSAGRSYACPPDSSLFSCPGASPRVPAAAGGGAARRAACPAASSKGSSPAGSSPSGGVSGSVGGINGVQSQHPSKDRNDSLLSTSNSVGSPPAPTAGNSLFRRVRSLKQLQQDVTVVFSTWTHTLANWAAPWGAGPEEGGAVKAGQRAVVLGKLFWVRDTQDEDDEVMTDRFAVRAERPEDGKRRRSSSSVPDQQAAAQKTEAEMLKSSSSCVGPRTRSLLWGMTGSGRPGGFVGRTLQRRNSAGASARTGDRWRRNAAPAGASSDETKSTPQAKEKDTGAAAEHVTGDTLPPERRSLLSVVRTPTVQAEDGPSADPAEKKTSSARSGFLAMMTTNNIGGAGTFTGFLGRGKRAQAPVSSASEADAPEDQKSGQGCTSGASAKEDTGLLPPDSPKPMEECNLSQRGRGRRRGKKGSSARSPYSRRLPLTLPGGEPWPRWRIGCVSSDAAYVQQQLVAAVRSIARFTYRSGFAPMYRCCGEKKRRAGGGPDREWIAINSDVGWGCTVRAAQMLLLQALKRHFLGAEEEPDYFDDRRRERKHRRRGKRATRALLTEKEDGLERTVETGDEEAGQEEGGAKDSGEPPLHQEEGRSSVEGCKNAAAEAGLCTLSESPTTTAASPLPSAAPSPPEPHPSKMIPSASNSICSSVPVFSLSQRLDDTDGTMYRAIGSCQQSRPLDTNASIFPTHSAKMQLGPVSRSSETGVSSPQSVEDLLEWFLDVPSPPAAYPFSIFSFIRAAGGGIGWARQLYGELGLEEQLFCVGKNSRVARTSLASDEKHTVEEESCSGSCDAGEALSKEDGASTLIFSPDHSTSSVNAHSPSSAHTFGDGPANTAVRDASPRSPDDSSGSYFLSSAKKTEARGGSTNRHSDSNGRVAHSAARFERSFNMNGQAIQEDGDENPLERRGLGKFAGEWFGPATASSAVKLLVESVPQTKDTLFVYVSADGLLYPEDILVQCLEPVTLIQQQGDPSCGPSSDRVDERPGAGEMCVCCPCCCASARRESSRTAQQGEGASHFLPDEGPSFHENASVAYPYSAAFQDGVSTGSLASAWDCEGKRGSTLHKRRNQECASGLCTGHPNRASESANEREHTQSRAHNLYRVRELPSSPGAGSVCGSGRNGNGSSACPGNAAEEEDWEEIPFCSNRSPVPPPAAPLSRGRASTSVAKGCMPGSLLDSRVHNLNSVHPKGSERFGAGYVHRRERRWDVASSGTSSAGGRRTVEGGRDGCAGCRVRRGRDVVSAVHSTLEKGRSQLEVDRKHSEDEQTIGKSGAQEREGSEASQLVVPVQKAPLLDAFEPVEAIVLSGLSASGSGPLCSAPGTGTKNGDSHREANHGSEEEGLLPPPTPRVIPEDSTSALPAGIAGGSVDPSAYMMLSSPKGPRPVAFFAASEPARRGFSSAPSSPRSSSHFSGSSHKRLDGQWSYPKTASSATSWLVEAETRDPQRGSGAAGAAAVEFLTSQERKGEEEGLGQDRKSSANCLDSSGAQKGIDSNEREVRASGVPRNKLPSSSVSHFVTKEGNIPSRRRFADCSNEGEERNHITTIGLDECDDLSEAVASETSRCAHEVLHDRGEKADCSGRLRTGGTEVRDGGTDGAQRLSSVPITMQGGDLSTRTTHRSNSKEVGDSLAPVAEVLPFFGLENLSCRDGPVAPPADTGRERPLNLEGFHSEVAGVDRGAVGTPVVGNEAATSKHSRTPVGVSPQPFQALRATSAPAACSSRSSRNPRSLSPVAGHCPETCCVASPTTLAVRYVPPFSLSSPRPAHSSEGKSASAADGQGYEGDFINSSVMSPSPPSSRRCLDVDFSDDNTPPTVNSAALSPFSGEKSTPGLTQSPSPDDPALSPEESGLLYPLPCSPALAMRRSTPLSSSSPPVPRLRALPNCMLCISSISPSGARSGGSSGMLSSSRSRRHGGGGAVKCSSRCESGGRGGGTASGLGSPSPSLSASLPLNTSRSEGSAAPSDGSATGRWCSVEALLPGPDEDLLLASSVLVSHRNTQRSYSPSYSPAPGTTRRSFGSGRVKEKDQVAPSVTNVARGGGKDEGEGGLDIGERRSRREEYQGAHEDEKEEACGLDDTTGREMTIERGTSQFAQDTAASAVSHSAAPASQVCDDDGEGGWVPFLPFVPASSSSSEGHFGEGTGEKCSGRCATKDVQTALTRGKSHQGPPQKREIERSRMPGSRAGGGWCDCREGGLFDLSARSARHGSESARATPGTSKSTSSRTTANHVENEGFRDTDERRQVGAGHGGGLAGGSSVPVTRPAEASGDKKDGLEDPGGLVDAVRGSRCVVDEEDPSSTSHDSSRGESGRGREDWHLKEDPKKVDEGWSSDSSSPGTEDEGRSSTGDNRRWRRGCLLLFPLTLCTGDKISPVYVPSLLAYLELPWSLGMVAGRGQQAFYVVGTQEKTLLYLDPHSGIQPPALELPSAIPSFFAGSCWKLADISALNPSLSIAFFVRSTRQLRELASALRHIEKADQYAMLQVVDDSRGRRRDCYAFSEDDDHLLLQETDEEVGSEVQAADEGPRTEEQGYEEASEQTELPFKDNSVKAVTAKELGGPDTQFNSSLEGTGNEKSEGKQEGELKNVVSGDVEESGEREPGEAKQLEETTEQRPDSFKERKQSDEIMTENSLGMANHQSSLGGELCSDERRETKESTSAESEDILPTRKRNARPGGVAGTDSVQEFTSDMDHLAEFSLQGNGGLESGCRAGECISVTQGALTCENKSKSLVTAEGRATFTYQHTVAVEERRAEAVCDSQTARADEQRTPSSLLTEDRDHCEETPA
ncbi:autophagy-related cysteine peptidase atg4 [Cystoisospora suis]|uniref:Autophagy-related cysteine peptidase atg4 n=1 Tax=Cystoisospora suis TaxID=483139 RepID=A0A2C6LBE2_9APIC|nr:autophagy-related cysteine peptidase atg4 [Cystoisospora suis]